mgnify:CR=1 FL=1
MLEIKNVTRVFGSGETGFKNLDLTVEKGEVVGILGTSGSGKSTLLRVLSGLDDDYRGIVSIDDEVVSSVHEKIGMIFQEPRLLPWLTVSENIGFGIKNGDKKQEKVQEILDAVGLTGFENLFPKDLSGGMAQRVAIARALVTAPEILLLDEPFSALDAFTKMQLQDLLLSIWQKYHSTFLLVTHDIDEALYLCDRIIVMRGQPGEIYYTLTIDQQRPRTRGDAELAHLKEKIINLLDLSQINGQ